MSVLQHIYDLEQQASNTNTTVFDDNILSSSESSSVVRNSSPDSSVAMKSNWTETTTARSEMISISTNHGMATESIIKPSTGSRKKAFIIGLIIGMLVAANVMAVIIVLWQRSIPSATNSISTTTTTSTTSSTSTTTTTTSTTTTSTATTSSTSSTTTSTTTTSTTTTAPPSTACVSSFGTSFNNNDFIYSPTSQVYAAGMLNNQFGVYNAYSYGNVTSAALWLASQSSTSLPSYLALQTDRHLVIYTQIGATVLWSSNTVNNGVGVPFCLEMLDSGNLIWTDNTMSIIWQTNTTQSG